MARLLVFRGETLERELDLVQLPIKIGRASTNDLVLEDPVKSVSREHAEIRLEDDTFVLVDRQSENGIWVGGKRLASVALDAETVATIGPFRLRVERSPVATTATLEPTSIGSVAGIRQPEPVKPPAPTPPAPARASTAPKRSTSPPTPQQKRLYVGAAALVAVGLLIVAGLLVRSSQVQQPSDAIAGLITAAAQQMNQGACADALAQNIQPGLDKDPSNADLLRLKQLAEECVTQAAQPVDPVPAPVVSPTEAALASARELLAQGLCDQGLVQQIAAILTTEPDNQSAIALKAEAEKCATPTPVGPPPTARPVQRPPALAKRVAPEEGGLEPLANEPEADYQARLTAMRKRYDDAVAAAGRGPGRSVITAFEGIARDATPRYLKVADMLAEARREYRATALHVMAEARELASKERWNDALQRFGQAKDIDPSISIDAETAKINETKTAAGRTACTRARQAMTYAPADAPALYRRVIELLPSSDPCHVEAKQRVGDK